MPRLLRQRTVAASAIYSFFLQGGFFLLVYYVPIYFQSIDNVSAASSGVDNLPLILGLALCSLLTGHVIRIWGHYVPLMLAGAGIATVGAGLLYTLDLDTPSSMWIGYQILVGVGCGMGIQIPVSAAQSRVAVEDLAPVTSTVLFLSTIGSAFIISAGQAIFANRLIQSLALTAPSVDPQLVISTGASALREVFSPDVLPGILRAYMDGLKGAYALAIASLGVATLVSVAMEWRTFESAPATITAA